MIADRWIRTKSDEAAVDSGCTFDLTAAEKVKEFCHKFCRQSVGEWSGRPLELLPWQWEEIIAPLYGWKKADGTRRFRQAGIWVPKNNGKSTLCSALSLYELVGRGEPGALVVNIAASIEQAGIVYRSACDMVEQSPALNKHLWVRKNIKAIEFAKTRSLYKVMSGERGGGKHGYQISALIFDELQEQTDRELWDTMRANVGKRKNAILVSISTSGYRRESIGFEQFQYASKVKSGEIIDTAFLPVVYSAPSEADWTTLDTFKACNPSTGVTIDLGEVQEALNEARNEPRKESAYRTLRLNQWTGYATCWISSPAWQACGEDFHEEDLYGLPAFVGWDNAVRGDLAAFCLCVEKDGLLYLLPRAFIPGRCAEHKEAQDHVPYHAWQRAGYINFTSGDAIDPIAIMDRLAEDSRNFQFQEIGFDPAGMELIRQQCEQDHGWTMVSVPQRAKYLGGAAGYFERAITSKTIRHPNNPAFNWCLDNCAVKETPDGLFVFKGAGDSQRIDICISALIGISRWLVREPASEYVVFL